MRERLIGLARELGEFARGPEYVRAANEAVGPLERAAGWALVALLPALFVIVGIIE